MGKIFSILALYKVLIVFSIFILIIIHFIIKKIFFTQRLDTNLRKKYREEKIDTKDLLNNIHKSKPLYDKLKKGIHPDRFIGNDEKRILVEELSQRLREKQHNYNELLEIELEFKKITIV